MKQASAKQASAWIFVIAIACLGIGCTGNLTSLDVPLEYHPTDNGGNGGLTLPATKIYIAPVQERADADPERIGENREKDTPRPIYARSVSPMDFVHKALTEEFRDDGMNVVLAPEDADRIVKVTIERFWVIESNSYESQVFLAAEVTDKNGAVLATGVVGRGDDSAFGRSMSADNYIQVLSNATAKAINYLLIKENFQKALSTGTGG